MSTDNNENKKCSQQKITEREKEIIEKQKKIQLQHEAEVNRLEQIAKNKKNKRSKNC